MVFPRSSVLVLVCALVVVLSGCGPRPNTGAVAGDGDGAERPANDRSVRERADGQWWHDDAILAALELTGDQLQRIEELMAVSTGDAVQERQRERQLSIRYLRALAQDEVDPELVDRVGENLVDVLTSEHRRRVETARELRIILTQEQWTTLWEMAPQALQVGRFRVLRGPKIAVTDEVTDPSPTPAL